MREFETINNLGQMDAEFKGISLSSIEESNLIDSVFVRCMALGIFKSSFHGSTFEDCNMRGVQSREANFSDIEMTTSDMSEAFIHHAKIRRSLFKKVSFENSIFKFGDIDDVRYKSCDFSRAVFSSLEIKKVFVTGSVINRTAFRDCTFLACDFSKVTHIQDCYFANCAFIECKLPKGFDENAVIERFELAGDVEEVEGVEVLKVNFIAASQIKPSLDEVQKEEA